MYLGVVNLILLVVYCLNIGLIFCCNCRVVPCSFVYGLCTLVGFYFYYSLYSLVKNVALCIVVRWCEIASESRMC